MLPGQLDTDIYTVPQVGRFRRALRPASEIRRPALFNPYLP